MDTLADSGGLALYRGPWIHKMGRGAQGDILSDGEIIAHSLIRTVTAFQWDIEKSTKI